jgi:hypothetical protein
LPAFFVSSLSVADLLSFFSGPDFVFPNKDSLSFELLGWPEFVFLDKDSLSFEFLGQPDFCLAFGGSWVARLCLFLVFEVIGWVGQLHCCASHMAPTQLPRDRLCALLPVTAQCLQHNSRTFLYCLCVYLSLYNFLCHEVTVVTRILSSIVICKCISLATDPPPLIPHNCHFILFLAAFYTREIFQLIHNERLIHYLLFSTLIYKFVKRYNYQSTWGSLAATCLIIFYFIFYCLINKKIISFTVSSENNNISQ